MLYSRTSKYAVLALAEIARHPAGSAIPTRRIAEVAKIPYPLLAKILLVLNRAGLVESVRGKAGGIRLARAADDVTIQDIVVALEGDSLMLDCPLDLEPCACEGPCEVHAIWKTARDAVVAFLEKTTIRDVADARRS